MTTHFIGLDIILLEKLSVVLPKHSYIHRNKEGNMATKLKKSRIEKKFLIKKKMKFLSLKPSKDGKIIGIRKF